MHSPYITDSQLVGWWVVSNCDLNPILSHRRHVRQGAEILECESMTEYLCHLQLCRRKSWAVSVHSLQRWKLAQQKFLVNELQKAVDRHRRISMVIWHLIIIQEIFNQHELTKLHFILHLKQNERNLQLLVCKSHRSFAPQRMIRVNGRSRDLFSKQHCY